MHNYCILLVFNEEWELELGRKCVVCRVRGLMYQYCLVSVVPFSYSYSFRKWFTKSIEDEIRKKKRTCPSMLKKSLLSTGSA